MKSTTVLAASALLLFCRHSRAQGPAVISPATLPAKAAIAKLQTDIPHLLQQADVPGLSIALIRNGNLVWTGAFGVSNADTKKPVDVHTVFEAASLSKPVFAYAVLKLVDEGKLSLDSPLNGYLGNNYDVVNDDRINLITARMVLSHTSGFPNWRDNDRTKLLLIHFKPGEKFSYSGEGMVYLSKVVEKITGLRFEEFMQQYALRPLGMTASSYIWRSRYDSLIACRHDQLGRLAGRNQPPDAKEDTARDDGNAAASLQTTAGDYAKFLIALMNGAALKKATWEQMLTPQIRVDSAYPPVAWGLGIGLETMPEGEYCWHWGDNGDAKAYVTAFLPARNAVVFFADGSNGLSFTREILEDAIGGQHPAVAHLQYDRYNSPARTLLKEAIAKGASEALRHYRTQRNGVLIDEASINSLGYLLVGMKRLDDAILVFEQNTVDHPQSWNVWDSLAEAFMDKGDKQRAIADYERSLQLNPDNANGAQQIKKLRSN